MPNRTEARSAKAALTHATGRLPSLRLFSTLLIEVQKGEETAQSCACFRQLTCSFQVTRFVSQSPANVLKNGYLREPRVVRQCFSFPSHSVCVRTKPWIAC